MKKHVVLEKNRSMQFLLILWILLQDIDLLSLVLLFCVFGVNFCAHFPVGSEFSFNKHITCIPVYPSPEEQKIKQNKVLSFLQRGTITMTENLFYDSLTLPQTVFQMIPARFTSSMLSLNDLGIYLMVSLSYYKNTPLKDNRSVLWFFLETAFFEKKRENKIILDSTVHNPKENRAWFLLPQKYFRSENLCIL